ncbi:MAG TPA: extracellular solute-binding protein, partial [Solirubrobacterales bacterium]|nr:extracellular solute-binding protein [Solirubrobacterales bacterium]
MTPTLSFFVAIQPGGTIEEVSKRCSEESGGRYVVEPEFLPTEASQQREQLVRRLGADDSSIDIVGMDVIWTGEFANAGWVEEWTGPLKSKATEKVFPGVIETASFEGKLYAAPFNTNTQLLWYRKDLVKQPPRTWDEMIDQAERLGRANAGTIQVQANRYEGFTVWANALIESAGTQLLSGPETVDLAEGPTTRALEVMGRFANSSAAPTG